MNNKETITFRQSLVDRYKLSNGCSICGYDRNPRALCFDHLPDEGKNEACKSGSRAGGMYQLYSKKHPVEVLLEEISRCRLICCNCHMEYTHTRRCDFGEISGSMTLEYLSEQLTQKE